MTAVQIITIIISIVSTSFAIYFGLTTRSRNTREDVQEEAHRDSRVIAKLESISENITEMKVEMRNYREEVQAIREQTIRNEESLKSLHKRVDRMEQLLSAKGGGNHGA